MIKTTSSVLYRGVETVIFIKILKSFRIKGRSRTPVASEMEKAYNKCQEDLHARCCGAPSYASVHTCCTHMLMWFWIIKSFLFLKYVLIHDNLIVLILSFSIPNLLFLFNIVTSLTLKQIY